VPVKFSVRITQAAQNDLEAIWEYLAVDSREIASHFIAELEDRITTLEQFPERCPLISENDVLGTKYRHLLIGSYRILFRLELRVVLVLRIIHGARLLDSSLFD